MVHRFVRVAMVFMCWLASCKDHHSSSAASSGLPDRPPTMEVTQDRKDLLFSYMDADGGYHDCGKVQEVPESARTQVLVRDLTRSPEQVGAAEYLYVVDLRQANKDGKYSVSTVSRWSFEKRAAALGQSGAVTAQVAAGGAAVTVYGTSWCGVCARTRTWLKEHKVAFVDKDVERDSEAASELAALAAKAGLRIQGVPVLVVGEQVLMGFDEQTLIAALGKNTRRK